MVLDTPRGGGAAVLAALFALGCGHEGVEPEGQTRTGAAELSVDPVEPDGKSATAIILRWETEAPEEVGQEFRLRVTNTTGSKRDVSLFVVAMSPHGNEGRRDLRSLTVRANSTEIVPLRLDQLPFQSSEYSTVVLIGARYEEGLTPESLRGVEVFAEARYFTSFSDFASATARFIGAEAEHSQALTLWKPRGKAGTLRVAVEGRTAAVSSEGIGPETEAGVYSIHDGPPPSDWIDFAGKETER